MLPKFRFRTNKEPIDYSDTSSHHITNPTNKQTNKRTSKLQCQTIVKELPYGSTQKHISMLISSPSSQQNRGNLISNWCSSQDAFWRLAALYLGPELHGKHLRLIQVASSIVSARLLAQERPLVAPPSGSSRKLARKTKQNEFFFPFNPTFYANVSYNENSIQAWWSFKW